MAEYRRAIISFIDILGFRDIVAKRTCDEIAVILRKMRQFSEGNDSGEGLQAKVIQFSDSIIRVRAIDSEENEEDPYGALFHELVDIGMMQGDLANNNVYIRGGLTIGEVSFEGGTIFGPGFVRAYDLESRIANYPRVVIDRKILEEMKTDRRLYSSHNDLEEELGYIARQIRRGSDGIHYVDYLRTTLRNMDDPEDNSIRFLSEHKANILQNIKSRTDLGPESGKYLWAALYHNEFLGREFHGAEEAEALWITEEELPLLETIEEHAN